MIWTNRNAKNAVLICGLLLVAAIVIFATSGCTTTPEPTGEPTPTPTMEMSPISPVATPAMPDLVPLPAVTPEPKEQWPDESVRPLFQAASHAMVNLAVLLPIEATTHFHQLKLIRQLRRVDNGQVLFEAIAVTGIVGTDYIPEPGTKFAAGWAYDVDLEAEFGVKEAAEYIKPVWECVREPGDTEPCLCQMNQGDELTDCTEIVGQCESKDGRPQDADGFCYTDRYTEMPELYRQWLPVVFVERES